MNRAGWVYVLRNDGLPGCVKVGRTFRETRLRANELWRDYGTAHPFVVHSKHMVSDCVAVETVAHDLLYWCRVPKSELFRCDTATAQKAVLRAAVIVLGRPWYLRLWHWIILPRLERAQHAGGGRGTSSKHMPWGLMLATAGALTIWGLRHYQPDLSALPLPGSVVHTAEMIESAVAP